jgi:hypothetical protein
MSTLVRFTEAQLEELKSRNPCDGIAGRWVRLRKHGRKMIGPCPLCSDDRQSNTSTRFECDGEGWVCAVCPDGGDVIKLVMKVEGRSFPDAVAWLGGTREIDAEEEARRERERAALRAKRDREAGDFRERERRNVFEIWKRGQDAAGTPAEEYLKLRGVALPPGCKLRFLDNVPYYAGGAKDAAVIARAPVLLAPIMRVPLDTPAKRGVPANIDQPINKPENAPLARFAGLHMTYLDLQQPKGKLVLRDPETGELLPAKKVRGSKAGGHIVLWDGGSAPTRLIIGEGIEKVLAVWRALAELGRDITRTAFWTAVDLGNLGGKSAASLRHPTLKTEAGRARNVPGPVPDLGDAGIRFPDSVNDLVLLGDRGSDRFLTQCTLARAAARFSRPDRTVRVAWSPADADFDDLLREAA